MEKIKVSLSDLIKTAAGQALISLKVFLTETSWSLTLTFIALLLLFDLRLLESPDCWSDSLWCILTCLVLCGSCVRWASEHICIALFFLHLISPLFPLFSFSQLFPHSVIIMTTKENTFPTRQAAALGSIGKMYVFFIFFSAFCQLSPGKHEWKTWLKNKGKKGNNYKEAETHPSASDSNHGRSLLSFRSALNNSSKRNKGETNMQINPRKGRYNMGPLPHGKNSIGLWWWQVMAVMNLNVSCFVLPWQYWSHT